MRRVFIAGLLLGAIPVANAQFINGDFEAGSFSGWTITPTSNGATAYQLVEQFDIDGPGALGTNFAGRFSVGRASTTGAATGGIELTQSLGLIGGTSYTFSFDWAATRINVTTGNSEGGVFDLIVDGVVLATQNAGSTSITNPHYGTVIATFVAPTTTSYVVGARITRPFTIPSPTAPNLFQSVDNFSMSPVPEPMTLAALGLGLAAFAKRRRK